MPQDEYIYFLMINLPRITVLHMIVRSFSISGKDTSLRFRKFYYYSEFPSQVYLVEQTEYRGYLIRYVFIFDYHV